MVRFVTATEAAHERLLRELFAKAVRCCHPQTVLPSLLPPEAPKGVTYVFAAGKAAAEMAAVADAHLQGEVQGLAVTRYGHGAQGSTGDIEVIEAGHPVPDSQSEVAAQKMLAMAAQCGPDDRVVFLMSGGGSALLCAPIEGISAQRKRAITKFLLRSGAPIDEINCVRKRLSRIKGGGLASVAGTDDLLTIVISDVVGDAPADIASGPSIESTATAGQAIDILARCAYPDLAEIEPAILASETPTVVDHRVEVAATAAMALAAVADAAAQAGWESVMLGDRIEGEAREVGAAHAEMALDYRKQGCRVMLISGGELTVTMGGDDGKGGPNLEYLTSLMIGLNGAKGIEAIACDSDGIDGSEDNAGGYIGPSSLRLAQELGLDAAHALKTNNSYPLFEALGALVITGPTRTNINDIRIILIDSVEE
ncbi:MAG: DUF4147 domain-containing protein [Pseudomonadota bacterium]